ncbi:queuosine precursor transporter [Desulfonatronovibrio hydrogenovorans]|uniref:queuosine precursor transporter n=1 Tax=Desulfonatronovibrio hydrogenovorans TaxID=53245 RepID=UPI00048A679E|nr:queuosine precursor transporter [Desulfonatronovibrio hydrogenovorans]
MDRDNSLAFILLATVFSGSLVVASVISSKIITIGSVVLPAGILAYCITFVASDVISEIWGKEKAKQVVLGGFAALVVSLGLIHLALAWPGASFWDNQEAYGSVLGAAPRIILASLIAYVISQNHDVWAFHFWKKIFRGRHLWIRNNLSTGSSQVIDSVIFISIAFYGIMPILPLIVGQVLIKLLIAFMDTPVVYFLVWVIRRPGRQGLADCS